MALPVSNKRLEKRASEILERCSLLKINAQQQRSASAAGTLDILSVIRFFDLLTDTNEMLINAGSVIGLADYMKTQLGDPNLDVVAEFTAIRNQIVATLNWIRGAMPTGTFKTKTYSLGYEIPVSNTASATMLIFSAGDTVSYRTNLDALIALII